MRRALRRLWYLLRRRRLEAELAEEMAAHRAMAERDHVARGVDPREAALAARRAFGSSALAQDRARDVWIAAWLQDAAHDLRFAVRMLARERGFALTVVLVLGIGIGVNTAQFTIVDAMCLRGLPIPRADRVLYVAARDTHDREHPLSYPEFEDVRSAMRSFAGVAAFTAGPAAIADDDRAPDRVIGVRVSANAFQLLGAVPGLGRGFRVDDDVPGAPAVAVVSHTLWTERYGGDPAIVGRTVRVDGTPAVVIGVMPKGFGFPTNADVWQPLARTPGIVSTRRDARSLSVFGRLADDASLASARAEFASLGTRLARDYPDTNTGVRLSAKPIDDEFNADIHNPAWIAFTVAGLLILTIACANAANLLLMRAVARSHEIAVRASLGAGRWRIVRQLLVESIVLATLGGALGFVLSSAGVRLFTSAIPPRTLPYFMTYSLDGRILVVLIGASAATVLLFGVAPAIHLAQRGTEEGLKSGPRTGRGGAARWMTLFLMAEVALSIVLLGGVITAVREARAEQQADAVIDVDRVLVASVTLPAQKYATAAGRDSFYRQLDDRLANAASVERFAVATALPLGGAIRHTVEIDGRPVVNGDAPPLVDVVWITSGYFDVIGARLLRGRAFDSRDSEAGNDDVIVNARFADEFLSDGNPLGQRIRLTGDNVRPTAWLTVIGISPSVRQRPFGAQPGAVVYLPLTASPPATAALLVRTPSDPAGAAPLLRIAVREIDRDLPIYRVLPLEETMRELAWNGRLSYRLTIVLTCIALGLSIVGLYAVTAHGVAQGTRDIGIRVALGASSRAIVRMIVGRVLLRLAYAFVLGLGCTIAWGRLFGSAVPVRQQIFDPVLFGGIVGTLAVVALIASVVPAWRAVRIDPAVALRYE